MIEDLLIQRGLQLGCRPARDLVVRATSREMSIDERLDLLPSRRSRLGGCGGRRERRRRASSRNFFRATHRSDREENNGHAQVERRWFENPTGIVVPEVLRLNLNMLTVGEGGDDPVIVRLDLLVIIRSGGANRRRSLSARASTPCILGAEDYARR